MTVSAFQYLEQISAPLMTLLLRNVLYSTLAAAPILLLSLPFRRRRPHLVLGLWVLVLLRLVLPPDWGMSISARNSLGALPGFDAGMRGTETTEQLLLRGSTNMAGRDAAREGSSHHGEWERAIPWASIVLPFWLVGVLCSGGLLLRRINRQRALLMMSTRIRTPRLLALVERWRREFGIRRRVRLAASGGYLSPFTGGLLRPVIFLPEALVTASDMSTLETVIAHEVAHIKSWDCLWIRVQNVVQLLYFFHPVAWLASSQLTFARECICDQRVLSRGIISPEQYGRGMIALLKMNLLGEAAATYSPGFGSHRKKYSQRMNAILGGEKMNKSSAVVAGFMTALFGLFLLPMAGPKTSPRQEPAATTTQEMATTQTFPVEARESVAPVKTGFVSSRFGKRVHPIDKVVKVHRGIDIAAPRGTDVHSVADGIIRYAARKGKYGLLVELDHPRDMMTRYAQMDTILVKEGQQVKAGEIVGKVGTSGISTGPHLHFEMHKDGKPVNPEESIDFSGLLRNKSRPGGRKE